MARYLFTVWPFPGHIHPNVAVARALRQRGHDVAFYTAGRLSSTLEAEGIRVFPFARLDAERVDQIIHHLDAHSLEWWRARETKVLLREWLLGTLEAQLEDVTAAMQLYHPDAIVCDPAMWAPLLVSCETTATPLAVMSYVAACMLPGPEGPILGVPLRASRSAGGRLVRRLLRGLEGVVAADVRRGAEGIRAAHGLPAMQMSVTAFAGKAPLYLMPGSPEYDRSRSDLPSSVHYVGLCEWDTPDAAASPAWLSELSREQKVVYVTEGTMHAKKAIVLAAALEGLASEPVQVVATTGRHRDPEMLGVDVPSNARVERFIPHSELLRRVDVVVTTGGTGTVLAALAAGVPLVVVPTAWDQPENAWRIVEGGAGVRVPPRQCSPASLRAAVQRVLGDASYRHNAQRLGASFARRGGVGRAADLLEQLLANQNVEHRAASPKPVSGHELSSARATGAAGRAALEVRG